MKTLKNTFFLACLLTVNFAFSALAKDKNNVQQTLTFSIDNYAEALKSGQSQYLSDILANNVKFNINRGGKIITYGKAEALKENKQNGKIIQNCEISYQVIAQSDTYALANISMKYENFTRENIVSFTKQDGIWKITEVNSVFK